MTNSRAYLDIVERAKNSNKHDIGSIYKGIMFSIERINALNQNFYPEFTMVSACWQKFDKSPSLRSWRKARYHIELMAGGFYEESNALIMTRHYTR